MNPALWSQNGPGTSVTGRLRLGGPKPGQAHPPRAPDLGPGNPGTPHRFPRPRSRAHQKRCRGSHPRLRRGLGTQPTHYIPTRGTANCNRRRVCSARGAARHRRGAPTSVRCALRIGSGGRRRSAPKASPAWRRNRKFQQCRSGETRRGRYLRRFQSSMNED